MERTEAGQGLIEYGLLLLLFSIATNALWDLLGQTAQRIFCEALASASLFPDFCAGFTF